jgi:hypothetical protein
MALQKKELIVAMSALLRLESLWVHSPRNLTAS